MSQNNPVILHVGLDVAKLSLELHLADQFHSLANDATGHTQLRKLHVPYSSRRPRYLVQSRPAATNNPSCAHCRRPKLPVSIIEAARVRYHARAQGQRAKTDPIDAAVLLSSYGRTFKPAGHPRGLAPATAAGQPIWPSAAASSSTPAPPSTTAPSITPIRLCVRQDRQLHKLLDQQTEQCDAAITALIVEDAGLARKKPNDCRPSRA